MSITITEADREAAVPILLHLYGNHDGGADALFERAVIAGKYDNHYLIQAFARHREQARRDALDEAAKVAMQSVCCVDCGEAAAAAIRALKEQPK